MVSDNEFLLLPLCLTTQVSRPSDLSVPAADTAAWYFHSTPVWLIVTGLWQIADIERDNKVLDLDRSASSMNACTQTGFTTFDLADHFGSDEKIAGIFTHRYADGDDAPVPTTRCPLRMSPPVSSQISPLSVPSSSAQGSARATTSRRCRRLTKSDPAAQSHFVIDKIEWAIQSPGGRLKDVVRMRICRIVSGVCDIIHLLSPRPSKTRQLPRIRTSTRRGKESCHTNIPEGATTSTRTRTKILSTTIPAIALFVRALPDRIRLTWFSLIMET